MARRRPNILDNNTESTALFVKEAKTQRAA
jgi:hypothetical protein